MIHRSLIIADDFYGNAEEVRQRALNVEYTPRDEDPYPAKGVSSKHAYLTQGMMNVFSALVGTEVEFYALATNGRFRLCYENATGTHDIHSDRADWSVVLYLNPPESCQGGTSFWRHNETGAETRTEMLAQIVSGKYRVKGCEPGDPTAALAWIREEIYNKQGLDRSLWTEVMTIPAKFNRALILRPNFWHSPTNLFGTTKESARLIQTFFFREHHPTTESK